MPNLEKTPLEELEEAIAEYIQELQLLSGSVESLESLKRTFKSHNITVQDWNELIGIVKNLSTLNNAQFEEPLNKLKVCIEELYDSKVDLTTYNSKMSELDAEDARIDASAIHKTGIEFASGKKTFNDGAAVPNLTSSADDTTVTNKKYVDDTAQTLINDYSSKDNARQQDIATINGKIPTAASTDNPLVDKATMNSSIAQNAGYPRGNFENKAALLAVAWQTEDPTADHYVTNNDYAVVNADESHVDPDTGTPECWRYKFFYNPEESEDGEWRADYKVNNGPMTAPQWAAVNSGATQTLINKIVPLENNKQNNVIYSETEPTDPKEGDVWVKRTVDNTVQYTGSDYIEVNNVTGTITIKNADAIKSNNTIAIRGTSGTIEVGTPYGDDHAVNKKYAEETLKVSDSTHADNADNASNANHATVANKANLLVSDIRKHELQTGYLTQQYLTFYGFNPGFHEGDIVCLWFECTIDSNRTYEVNLGTVRVCDSSYGSNRYYDTYGTCRGYDDACTYNWEIEHAGAGMGSWHWSMRFTTKDGAVAKPQDVLGTAITSYKFCYMILCSAHY